MRFPQRQGQFKNLLVLCFICYLMLNSVCIEGVNQ